VYNNNNGTEDDEEKIGQHSDRQVLGAVAQDGRIDKQAVGEIGVSGLNQRGHVGRSFSLLQGISS
jgi:hypothetical protein